ncbi:MAG: glutamine synthetase family protein [Candidatus Bathyarchaeota archaeon]|nr:glutamine synthetase family protein [Candidatus Bathyarchaeota archaeon]
MVDLKLTHGESIGPLMNLVKKHDIKYVRLVVVDLGGSPRAMLIPEYELDYALSYGIGFDGSSIAGFREVNRSDLVANPDPSTFLVPMWEAPGVAIMFCYVSNPDGTPFEGDPRGLLKKTVMELEERGYGYNTGPELEFFYINEQNGSISPFGSGGYFDLPPLDPTEDIKMETMMCLEAAGFQLDRVHHEAAQGQQEINFRYSEAMKTADNVVLYKLAVKTIAQKHGRLATFMPKPFWGINGSGCHVHQSLVDLDTGHNIFFDGDSPEVLSDEALHYIGGILDHAKGLSLVVAPLVNSYKRLVPHFEAPVYISWGFANRSALVRVPQYPVGLDMTARIEYRHPDPSCNPYLSAVAMLKAGMDGIENKIDPMEPISENVYNLTEAELDRRDIEFLPEHLEEAADAFVRDPVVSAAIGGYIAKNLVELKRHEYEEYTDFAGQDWAESRPRITSWEIDRYLTRC